LGIVIGGGLLSLPGLVYAQAGGWAVFSWLLDGMVVLPLLVIFAALARTYPTAGGVAGFVGQAFPKLQMGCSFLLIGTFGLGIPAIALTGASYLVGVLFPDAAGDPRVTALAALVLLLPACATALLGARVAGFVQNIVVALLIGGLFLIVFLSIPSWHRVDFSAGQPSIAGLWQGAALAFFAYTGWEMLSFTAEEFRNPRRDFVIATAISFILVLGLYAGISLAVQALPQSDEPSATPLLAVILDITHSRNAAGATALLMAAIILVNLNGAFWASSRLVFDIARHGWLPCSWNLTELSQSTAAPRRAILAVGLIFIAVLVGYGLSLWDLSLLLRLAGQNFFLLYAASTIVFFKLARTMAARAFGVLALIICILYAGVFSWGLLYAGAIFALPYAARKLLARTAPLMPGVNDIRS
jgi:amino acid efflux transporter